MSKLDSLLKKMNMVSDDEYDDYDEYDEDDEVEDDMDDEEEEEEEKPKKKGGFFSRMTKSKKDDYDDFDDYDDDEDDEEESFYSAPAKKTAAPQKNNVYGLKSGKGASQAPEVCMIMPKSFDDANTIADMLLKHKAVVLNLEGIDMAAAQRLIDFASGSCYTVGGSLQKISKKIFIVVPQEMNLSGDFDDLVNDMVDLNSVNMMK